MDQSVRSGRAEIVKAGVDIWCEVYYKSDALWSERGGREWWTGSICLVVPREMNKWRECYRRGELRDRGGDSN